MDAPITQQYYFLTANRRAMDNYDMPILPLKTVPDLFPTLRAFTLTMAESQAPQTRYVSVVRDLLPYCDTERKLPERSTNFLSDISSDLRGLVDCVATEEGRDRIATLIGDEDAARVFAFFAYEFPNN